MLDSYSDILTVDDMCVILQIGKNKAYELLQAKVIRSKKVGHHYRILKASVIEYLSS